MGFAASQARLLVLTARKSDLEFRAQQITNAEMMLAMRSEEVANKYSRALSNQTCKLLIDGEGQAVNASNLSLAGMHPYRVKTNSDGVAEADLAQPWDPGFKEEADEISYVYKLSETRFNKFCEDNKISDTAKEDFKDAIEAALGNAKTFSETTLPKDLKLGTHTMDELIAANVIKAIPQTQKPRNDEDFGRALLDAVNNGQVIILNDKGEEVSLHNGTAFSVCYDTSDDEAADAIYRAETAAIQVKEKRLQMELTQIEAQQKACESEIDGVKKIMQNHADKDFKVFS